VQELERLKEIILEKSYREGEFTLSSGKNSTYYIDMRQTTLHCEGNFLICKLLYDLVPEDIKAVGGLTMGADPLVTGLSFYAYIMGRKIHAFYVRKESKTHGTSNLIEGLTNLKKGEPVIILEDVVTTGESAMKAVNAARGVGLIVKQVLAVVDREEGGSTFLKENGVELKVLFKRSELAHGL